MSPYGHPVGRKPLATARVWARACLRGACPMRNTRRDGAFAPSETFIPSLAVGTSRQVRRKRSGRGGSPVRQLVMSSRNQSTGAIMLEAIEAEISPDGRAILLEPLHLSRTVRAVVTIPSRTGYAPSTAAGRGIRPVPNVYSVAGRWCEPAGPEKTFRTGRMPRLAIGDEFTQPIDGGRHVASKPDGVYPINRRGTGHSPRPKRLFRRRPLVRADRSAENVPDGANAPSGLGTVTWCGPHSGLRDLTVRPVFQKRGFRWQR